MTDPLRLPWPGARWFAVLPLVFAASPGAPVLAQTESYLLGPGSSVGPSTRVKPKNCVTAPDGAITCDTELENSPSNTEARPQFELFKN